LGSKMYMSKFELYKELLKLSKEENVRTWKMGELLYGIKENKGWKGIAESWRAFLSDPEFEQSPLTLERYLRLYDFYGQKLGLKQEDIAGIDVKILGTKKIKDKLTPKNALKVLEKFRVSYSDAMRLLRFGNKNPLTCKHKWSPLKQLYECSKCGERTQNPDEK